MDRAAQDKVDGGDLIKGRQRRWLQVEGAQAGVDDAADHMVPALPRDQRSGRVEQATLEELQAQAAGVRRSLRARRDEFTALAAGEDEARVERILIVALPLLETRDPPVLAPAHPRHEHDRLQRQLLDVGARVVLRVDDAV